MRLIDADALKKEIRENDPFGGMNYEWYIDHASTIAAPRWHRVEDKLPVKGEIVIVSDGKRTWDVGQYHCLVSSDDRTKWWWKGHTIKTVKWWMRKKDALPEPPKEDA